MNGKKSFRALIIDDEKVVRDFLVRFLEFKGLAAKSAENASQAIALAKTEKFDIVFLEISMPNDGVELLKELKKIAPSARYVAITAFPQEEILEEAKKEGVSICLKKPFDLVEIMFEVNQLQ